MRPVPGLMGLGRAFSNLTPKVYTRRQLEGGKPYRPVPSLLQQITREEIFVRSI